MKCFALTLTLLTGLVASGAAVVDVHAQDASSPAASTDAALPNARVVFQRHLDAIGDADKIAEVKNIVLTGEILMPAMGLKGELEIVQVKPDKVATVMTLPQVGEQTQVFDGEIGWMGSPVMGVQRMSDKQLAQTKAQLAVETMEGFRRTFKKARIVEKLQFNGEESYKMEAITKDDDKISMFFSLDSGLMNGMKMVSATPMGDIPVEVLIDDYKPAGPMMVARTTKIKAGPTEMVMKVNDVEVDAEVPESKFERPEGL